MQVMSKSSNYIVVGVWLAALLSMLVWIAKTIQIQSDLSLFLPEQKSILHSLLIHQLNQGKASRTLFISIERGTVKQRVGMSRQLTEKLQNSPLFEQVFNGQQPLGVDETSWFFQYRYLLSPNINAASFSKRQLKSALVQRLDELALPFPTLDKRYFPHDPTVELRAILNRIKNRASIRQHNGIWTSENGTQAIIVAQTSANAVDLNKQQKVIEFIESSFRQLNSGGILQFQLTGLPVASILSREIIQSESRLFSLAASLALLVILYFGFRSLRLILLSSIPILSAIIAGLFTILIWFHSIHGITLVFAITILGIAIDYPLHMFSHLDPEQPSSASIKKIWSTMRVGLLTTAIAFLTLVFSNFEGLFQLGLFAATGLLMAALTTRFILPNLIGKTQTGFQPTIYPVLFSKTQGLLLIALSLLFIVIILSLEIPEWEENLSSLSPLPETYIKRDKQLRSMVGGGDLRYIGLIKGKSTEQVLQLSEKLRPVFDHLIRNNIIQNYDMAANYIPSQSLQDDRRSLLPSQTELKLNLKSALEDLPFKLGLFNPFLEDIERTKNHRNITINDLRGVSYESAVQSLLMKQNSSHFAIINISGLTDHKALMEKFDSMEDNNTDFSITIHDLHEISSDLLIQFYSDFLKRAITAIFIIGLILLLTLRDLHRTLLVTSVLLISLLVEISILVALGHHFNLFHMVSFILVFGLGLDYALFFSRKESLPDKHKTFHGLLICVISSALVFGILAMSKIPVLHTIGMTTALGVLLAFFFSMLMTTLFDKN